MWTDEMTTISVSTIWNPRVVDNFPIFVHRVALSSTTSVFPFLEIFTNDRSWVAFFSHFFQLEKKKNAGTLSIMSGSVPWTVSRYRNLSLLSCVFIAVAWLSAFSAMLLLFLAWLHATPMNVGICESQYFLLDER